MQGAGLVSRVLENHIALLVLVLAERDKDDVSIVDPDLLAKLASNEAKTLDAVEALKRDSGSAWRLQWQCWRDKSHHGFETAVPEHLKDLGVFLAILLERELTLLVAVVATGSASRRLAGLWRWMGAPVGGVAWGGRGISHSFSFFPLRLFLPPFPLFLGIFTVDEGFAGLEWLVFQGGRAGELEKLKAERSCGVGEVVEQGGERGAKEVRL